jgi:aspartate ammonia-lyase
MKPPSFAPWFIPSGDVVSGIYQSLGERAVRHRVFYLEKASSWAAPGYPELATRYLSALTGFRFILAGDLVKATSDSGAYVLLSGVLKRTSSKLTKICNDIRMLASGPRRGLTEINLPQLQPGSSIMPGKVNPVIPEVVNQVGLNCVRSIRQTPSARAIWC